MGPSIPEVEFVFQIVVVLSSVIGFVVGYSAQQLSYTMYTLMGGFCLACLIVLPPWPFLFRQHPLKVCTGFFSFAVSGQPMTLGRNLMEMAKYILCRAAKYPALKSL